MRRELAKKAGVATSAARSCVCEVSAWGLFSTLLFNELKGDSQQAKQRYEGRNLNPGPVSVQDQVLLLCFEILSCSEESFSEAAFPQIGVLVDRLLELIGAFRVCGVQVLRAAAFCGLGFS